MLSTSIPSSMMQNFYVEEDHFSINMHTTKNVEALKGLNGGDPQLVTLFCANKHKMVTGILKNSFGLSAKANWTPFLGGNKITKFIKDTSETVNNTLGWIEGKSMQQPWFNRKVYSSTNPLKFDLDLVFYAEDDPVNDVWNPIHALLTFVYPKVVIDTASGKEVGAGGYLKNQFDKYVSNDKAKERLEEVVGFFGAVTSDTVVGDSVNAFKLFNPPGPTVAFDKKAAENKKENQGDPVTVQIGSLWNLEGCYIEDLSIKFFNSWSVEGYPLAAEAKLSVSLMDSCYVDGNNELLGFTEFADNPWGISKVIDKARGKAWQLAGDIVDLGYKTIGFYKTAVTSIGQAIGG